MKTGRFGLSGRDLAFAIICPTAMAAGFIAAKTVLDVLPPILLSALRHTIAAAILIWFVTPPIGTLWRLFWITFIGATVHFALTYGGIARLDVSTAVLLIQSEVPFAMIVGAFVTRKMPSTPQIAGTVIGLIGTVIVFGTPSVQDNYGAAFMLLFGAFTWAVSQNMIPGLKNIGPFQLATWLAVLATLQLWPVSFALEGNPLPYLMKLKPEDFFALLIVGVGPTIIGYGLWCLLIARHGVVKLAPFLLLIPMIAIGIGVVLLDEKLSLLTALGGAVTLIGVALTLKQPPEALEQSLGNKDA